MPASFSGLNYVNVGPRGTFTQSGRLSTTPADIDAIFAHLDATRATKLVVHFHGGLVSEGAGLNVARKLAPIYASAGSHPVTFVWETGLVETIIRNLTTVHSTKLFRKLLTYVVRHVAKRVGGGIGAKGPGEELTDEEILREIAGDDAFDRFDEGARGGGQALREDELPVVRDEMEAELQAEIEADDELLDLLDSGMAETEHLKPEVLGSDAPGAAKGLVSTALLAKSVALVAFNVLRRYARGTEHGVYPTVVEEILRELYLAEFGGWVWAGMKNVARDMWLPNGSSIDDDSHVGTYFIEKLSAYQQAHPDFIVDLIGHSAGSIAICEMFRACAERNTQLTIRNVVFLAPACRADLFVNEILRPQGRFAAFRMFTMRDELEARDRLLPGVYTRSLLYFIAGVLEEEPGVGIAGLERQLSGRRPYDSADYVTVREWLGQTNRLVLSATDDTASPGLGAHAARHGDFDDDERTLQSIVALIS
jgi:hypothetical protein